MNSLKKAMSGYGRTVIFSVIGILVVVVIGYRVMENRKKNEKTVSVMQSFDTSHREKVSADASPEYKDHLKEIDQKKEAEAIKSGKPFVANPLEAGDFTGNVCSPTTQGGVYMDAKGHLLVASVGGSGPLVDKNGIPIRDASGKQIIVPKGFYALVGPDGKPLLDAKGKPYIVSDKYRAVLGPDGKPLLGPDGKPILVPKGYHVAFGPDGKPLLGPDGKPILVPKGYHVAFGPDGKPLLGPDGKPIIVPNGYHVALGPDGKPLLGPDGKPIIVPDGSHVAICDGKPLLGPDGKPIIVKDGQSVKVGRGCRVLLGKNGAPVILDKDGQRVSAGTGSGTGGSRTDVNGDPLGAVNDALSYAHNSSGVAPSEEAMKASQKAFEDREKAMMGEMASISEAVFPSKPSSPPIQDYLPKKKATAKTVAAVPPQKKTMSVGKKYHIPDAILALLRPGRIYYGTIDGMVSSDVPGPVLATVQSGKLSGAKMLGKFKKSHNYLAIQFFSMTMPNGDVYPVTAYAVDASTEQDGLASNVDHHYWSRYGALLGGAFLYGFGQAEMYAGGAGTVTQFGTPVFVPNTSTAISQTMMGLGQAGQTLSQQETAGFNRPNTVTVDKGKEIGILIMHAGPPDKNDNAIESPATPKAVPGAPTGTAAQPAQPTQPTSPAGPQGYSPLLVGGQGGMSPGGATGGMPMMPMMP